jgi:hypothetical protein
VPDTPDVTDLATAQALIATLRGELTRTKRENAALRQLRGVALGRKNWLFAGGFEGARRTALLYSLVQSCALVGVPPFNHFKDVLPRVATHPQRLIGQLTPRAGRDLRSTRRGVIRWRLRGRAARGGTDGRSVAASSQP